MTLVLPLRPNKAQQDALQKLTETRAKKAGLVALATGVGKTYLATWDTIRAGARSILYVVHQNDILKQNAEEFVHVYEHNYSGPIPIADKVGKINAANKDYDKPIVFATWQTLLRHLDWLKSKEWDYVIFDECHHIAAETFDKVFGVIKARYKLGLTATPFRMDGKPLEPYFNDNVIIRLNVNEAIRQGHLAPYQYHALSDNIDYSKIKRGNRGYNVKDCERKLIIKKRNEAILREFKEQIPNRRTIGFCVSVKHTKKMEEVFRAAGIKAVAVTHEDSRAEREEIRNGVASGKYQVVFTKDLYNEGVNFPEIDAVLYIRPTESDVVFTQQIGRGLRKAVGKHNCVILDFVGNQKGAEMRMKVLDIKPENLKKGQARPHEEIVHDVPMIWFQDEQIEYLERLDRPVVTKERLIQIVHEFYKNKGRPPKIYEFAKLGICSIGYVIHIFGSYCALIREAGHICSVGNPKAISGEWHSERLISPKITNILSRMDKAIENQTTSRK